MGAVSFSYPTGPLGFFPISLGFLPSLSALGARAAFAGGFFCARVRPSARLGFPRLGPKVRGERLAPHPVDKPRAACAIIPITRL